MVKDAARKNAIRARMTQTGKSYTDAARELEREAAEVAEAPDHRRQPVITFEWFSGQAHGVVDLAREHARSHGHGTVGTEHLLLGLIDDQTGGLAFEILDDLAGAVEVVESAVAAAMPPGATIVPQDLAWSEHAAFVLARGADRQRDRTGHGHIGPEHLLLALLARGDSRACQILTDLRITYESVRTEVVDRLNAMGVVSRYSQATHRG
ncbi:hypothetical protein GCM10009678_14700 [Actinomadura kijaniata]|uniref:ATP-dependent Clp protease ATP-binding subunit ClpA n=1 Tax=Actinomadura namibiensis TaxID=182080 RepID=A0A7W3LQT3_ACTNM|nr:Clp protease N-terminal domain-containing protein [Actinomadura namibiensis]MBA8952636.1 ATP-dependent Clp protease ATP-binding subunit ClpA [Actinomadura namibiensis]